MRKIIYVVTAVCAMSEASVAKESPLAKIGERSRDEIVAFFTDNEFGRRPKEVERPPLLRFEKTGDDSLVLDGAAVEKKVRIVYGGRYATNSFFATAYIPTKSKTPVPAFLLICNRHGWNHLEKDNEFFPIERIVQRGFAAVTFTTWDVAPDYNTGNTLGVFAAFEKPGPYRGNKLWGTLSAWAWGASRVLDWLERVDEVDSKRVAVVGHSRGGKTALWAAITDTRFACACVNGSGCAGAKLNHMDLPKSEQVVHIVRTFQYWFCADYTLWANREKEMPFDQHELLSCVAPRLLAVGSGTSDHWAGPDGEKKRRSLRAPRGTIHHVFRIIAMKESTISVLSIGRFIFLMSRNSG